jgi:hypothetical protein
MIKENKKNILINDRQLILKIAISPIGILNLTKLTIIRKQKIVINV